jgi:hypothetical protein
LQSSFTKEKKTYKTIVARFYVKPCKEEKNVPDDKPNKCLTKLGGE